MDKGSQPVRIVEKDGVITSVRGVPTVRIPSQEQFIFEIRVGREQIDLRAQLFAALRGLVSPDGREDGNYREVSRQALKDQLKRLGLLDE
ncbi:MAG: hypothetical protein UR28_C0003G0020 [Candidatus Peregrinibacteria bacterium GW2011_GWF2_33_10]|nr:MAG: hypothetical protein UR28_C0003G0020 [Candidatus Peregrinibacteria bacterium GW2011_GWF2_33_10]OGJ44043.1 MAG: hypothetical protein A2272_01350 [Candidatus Peregrinibacteria bacterium RIFOXYA12_FULL_33_12]OGJ44173.1 MAG: hypothetical protein A2263_04320 [Candidatus Peregrinibacteria bacterium RIFOXYA2_FULL_33_21]OGJ51802.1 MAG: hypothetical protein A2307_04985 [Candidatus Peregrinibacteria bacterium RIFOXYB2_FULL_33_20]